MFKNIKKVVFDYDNTLILHNSNMELEYMADYLNVEDRVMFRKQLSEYYGTTPHFTKNSIVTEAKYFAYMKAKMPYLEDNGISVKQFYEAQKYKDTQIDNVAPGARELLTYLVDRGYSITVLTNGFYDEQIYSMKQNGLISFFDKIYCWDNYYAKPHKLAFIRAIDKVYPYECVMVGDNLKNDILPAKALGMKTIGYNLNSIVNKKTAPDVIVKNLEEIKKII